MLGMPMDITGRGSDIPGRPDRAIDAATDRCDDSRLGCVMASD